jgi:hypothetical protein
MIRKRVVRHPVEPQQRSIDGDVIESAPEDEEHLARDVSSIIRADATLQVSQDGGIVLAEQHVEPFLARHLPTCMSVQFTV